MKAIILSAGKGTRLRPLTTKIPKCLVEVNGKSILQNALENLSKNDVSEVIIVEGYLGEKIIEKFGYKFNNMVIKYVKQKDLDNTSSSYALWLGLGSLDLKENEDLLILEGDVFFEETLLSNFIKSDDKNSTIVERYNPNLDGSFVEVSERNVIDWIHKSKRDKNFKIENKFKTVNIHKFSSDFVNNNIRPVIKKHIEEKFGTEPLEYVMQDIVLNGKERIKNFETNGMKWFEIVLIILSIFAFVILPGGFYLLQNLSVDGVHMVANSSGFY